MTPRAPIVWRDATVREVVDETWRARTLVLDVPGWPGHVPGQHVDVRLTAEDGYQAQRSYSIASAPETDGLAITVDEILDGELSPWLVEEAQPGDFLEVRGPVGGPFTWRASDGGPLLLVGAGSGVVPLVAMLRHRRLTGSDVDARMLVSARGPLDLLFRDELGGLGVPVTVTLTREQPRGWTGPTRRVDAAMLREVGPPPEAAPRIFVCGPTPFVERAANILVRLGHPPAAIRAERFGPSGTP